MRRPVWIFFAAILLPSLGLAWLAIRSAQDQQVILEHQQTIIDQGITDGLARDVNVEMDQIRKDFISAAQNLISSSPSQQALAESFDRKLHQAWNLAEIGFSVDLQGSIHSPGAAEGPAARTFLSENERFLSNRENVEIYSMNAAPVSQVQSQSQQILRRISPQQIASQAAFSNAIPEESDFRRVIGEDTSGEIARFTDNKLNLIVWWRPPDASRIVLGAQLDQKVLVENLHPLLSLAQSPDSAHPARFCLAILDDNGRPVATSQPGFSADWKHPFVATEIGPNLPHWEAALYLMDSAQIGRTARTLEITLGLIVLVLLVAIVAGGSLIAADIRRQALLARQKTDFVSNVSHELKTPLTSIRMFSELLAENRVNDPGRRASYLRIIAEESARLTRLINNVLDFARMERRARSPERRPCDLVEVTTGVIESCRPGMESAGISLALEIRKEPLRILGDPDSIAQALINLISNAEKYGGTEILVRLRREETGSGPCGCVDVLDRGAGIPPHQTDAVFEPFHRLADSLASGVAGSGLGLTLARHSAKTYGGDVVYKPREGGGSRFTFIIPLDPGNS